MILLLQTLICMMNNAIEQCNENESVDQAGGSWRLVSGWWQWLVAVVGDGGWYMFGMKAMVLIVHRIP